MKIDRDEVVAATDIVQLISEQMSLKPKGREFVGLCPFHDDHKPSMTVVPQKQLFKCFSCGAGGGVIDFVMKYHSMTFQEALKALAERVGLADGPGTAKRQANPEQREKVKPKIQDAEVMTTGEVVAALNEHRERKIDPGPWAMELGVLPEAIEMIGMITVITHPKTGVESEALVCPMRNEKGKLTSLRYRAEDGRRWCASIKDVIDGQLVHLKGSNSGLLTYEAFFDPDICRDLCITMVVEGETDLAAGVSIMISDFGMDPADWPGRWIGLPGVTALHDMLVEAPLGTVVMSLFDNDAAAHRATFNHRSMKVVEVDGVKQQVINLDQPRVPGLLSKLRAAGFQARACFPPIAEDGVKLDLRKLVNSGWRWDDLHKHCIEYGTADPSGSRVRYAQLGATA